MRSMGSAAIADNRVVTRDEVHYRARAYGPDARAVSLLIVNMSALGLMARCDLDIPEGSRLHVTLPVVGVIVAQVRWSLGGRLGCELDHPIDLAEYYELLSVLLKAR